jgi:predicted lipoprotein with Yx(FWY)xxD motif
MTTRIARWAAPATVALALLVAGCGSSGQTNAAAPAPTVSAKQLAGLGNVLVDANGHALYAAEQEKGGMIRCTGGCLGIWTPLTATAPTGGAGVTGKLATISRAGGVRQVTYQGMPLYRFSQDTGPGQVTGNGAKDAFGGVGFTWHAVTPAGFAAASSSSSMTHSGY